VTDLYQEIAALQVKGELAALCTITYSRGSTPRHAGTKMLVYRHGRISGTIGGGEMESRIIAEAQAAIDAGKPRKLEYSLSDPAKGDPGICGGQLEVFVEPILPKATVVVIGAGHVGKAVVFLAHWLGYRVVLSDDRAEFCNPEAVPLADEYLPGDMQSIPEQITIHSQTYLVLTTRSPELDIAGLPSLFATPAAYVGVIGSKRRWEQTRQSLLEAGLDENQLQRVVSPMGVDLNAETPEEIALSILAEITLLRNRVSES